MRCMIWLLLVSCAAPVAREAPPPPVAPPPPPPRCAPLRIAPGAVTPVADLWSRIERGELDSFDLPLRHRYDPAYRGELPAGLDADMDPAEVTALLGPPEEPECKRTCTYRSHGLRDLLLAERLHALGAAVSAARAGTGSSSPTSEGARRRRRHPVRRPTSPPVSVSAAGRPGRLHRREGAPRPAVRERSRVHPVSQPVPSLQAPSRSLRSRGLGAVSLTGTCTDLGRLRHAGPTPGPTPRPEHPGGERARMTGSPRPPREPNTWPAPSIATTDRTSTTGSPAPVSRSRASRGRIASARAGRGGPRGSPSPIATSTLHRRLRRRHRLRRSSLGTHPACGGPRYRPRRRTASAGSSRSS